MDALCACCHGLFRKYIGSSMKKGLFVNGMRIFVCMLNICPFYVANYEMNEYMKNEMDKKLYKFLLNFFLGMALLSYWITSLKKPRAIPAVPEGVNKEMCAQCRAWKPERAHHCQYCGVCVPRMDHHCPWVGNCIGYHNFKPFFLFCFYQMCSGIVFIVTVGLRSANAPDEDHLSPWGEICYWVTILLDMPICFALLGLSANIFVQIYENLGTIEGIGKTGAIQRRFPCLGVTSN